MPELPLVRVVVVNFDGGDLTLDCLESLWNGGWPVDRLDVVLVDNGSLDGVADRVRADGRGVTVLEPLANLGFAGGSNLGIRADGNPDYIALLNPDAVADPNWLPPLVTALEADPGLGAVAPKMVFARPVVEVDIRVPGAGRLGDEDGRELGVRLIDASWGEAYPTVPELGFGAGWHLGEEPMDGERMAVWSTGTASLTLSADPTSRRLRLTFRRSEPTECTVICDGSSTVVQVGAEATTVDIELDGAGQNVVQNAGSVIYAGGYGGDRGFREMDRGQYDVAEEARAWCGGAVLLRPEYLREVGVFDDRFFLYYEDLDLSWRGRLRGWRYAYEPASLVRHHHAQSTGEWSPLFRYQVDRNRLLVVAKNAPGRVFAEEWARAHARFLRSLVRDLVWPLCRIRLPPRSEVVHHGRVLWGAWRRLPGSLGHRWSTGRTVSRRAVYRTAEVRT